MSESTTTMIATPTHSGLVVGAHADSIRNVCLEAVSGTRGKVNIHCGRVRGGANIPRNRNQLVAMAHDAACHSIFFVDSDISFEPDDFFRLLNRPEEVVCGVYQKRPMTWGEPAQMTFNWGDEGPCFDNSQDLIKVNQFPTGFLRIKMSVFKKLRESGLAQQFCYQSKSMHLWPKLFTYFIHEVNEYPITSESERENMEAMGLNPDARLQMDGEDFDFAEKLKKIGVTAWMDPLCRLTHWEGSTVLPVTGHHACINAYPAEYMNWLKARADRGCLTARAAYDGTRDAMEDPKVAEILERNAAEAAKEREAAA